MTRTEESVARDLVSDDRTTPAPEVHPPDEAIWGLPGTGKTKALLDRLEEELQSPDVHIQDVVATTFRKLMAEDFRTRARDTLDADLPTDHYIRTTHSICYHYLDLKPKMVVDWQDKAEFIDSTWLPIEYKPPGEPYDDQKWLQVLKGPEVQGNMYFGLRSYCLNNLLDPITEWRKAHEYLTPDRRRALPRRDGVWREFNEAYEEWKDHHGLVDYDDMLQDTLDLGGPNPRVLIWDEFQDVSPLQLQLYNRLAREADKVYVSGDPYQTLYRFMGAQPSFMWDAWEAADTQTFQGTCYRYGQDVWSCAEDILNRGGYTVPAVTPAGESNVERLPWDRYRDTLPETVKTPTFHLSRTNWYARRITEVLEEEGIPYTSPYGGWTGDHLAVYNAVVRLEEAIAPDPDKWHEPDLSPIPNPEWEALLPCLPSEVFRGTKKQATTVVEDPEERWKPLEHLDLRNLVPLFDPNPFHALLPSHIERDPSEHTVRNRLTQAWVQHGTPFPGVRHEVTTIHGAKGRERPLVYLYDATSNRIQKEAERGREACIYFTGATRAEDTLRIVRTKTGTRTSLLGRRA